LEFFEEILKNCQLSPEDQLNATAWNLSLDSEKFVASKITKEFRK
ncbi:8814_t:CDS:2, partial [Dentiscutata erythropus]